MCECLIKLFFVHSSKVSIEIFLIEGNVFHLMKLTAKCKSILPTYHSCKHLGINLFPWLVFLSIYYSFILFFYYSILYAIDSDRSASETTYTDTLFFIHSIEYMHPSPHWLFVLECQNSRDKKNLSRVLFSVRDSGRQELGHSYPCTICSMDQISMKTPKPKYRLFLYIDQ